MKEAAKEGHGFMVDFYSIGVLLYEMIVGIPPFIDSSKMNMFNKIMYSNPKYPSYISEYCQDLLIGLLEKDPSKRLGSVNGFLDVKSHPYFKDIDWDNLKRVPVIIPSFTASNFTSQGYHPI